MQHLFNIEIGKKVSK